MIEEIKATYQETLARKREEFEASLERGEVADPITLFGVVITWQAIAASAAISVAVAAASYALGQAFAPKPPRQQIGKMQGTLQMMNSEQGLMIPEIYGAGPTATLVTGSNPTWQNLTNTTGGANGSITKTSGTANFYDAGASHNVAVASGDAFIEVIASSGSASAGFSTTASPTGNLDWKLIKEMSGDIPNAPGLTVEVRSAQIARGDDIVKISVRFDFPEGAPVELLRNSAPPGFDISSISRFQSRFELNCKTLTIKPWGKSGDVYQFNGKHHKSKEPPFKIESANIFAQYFCEQGDAPTKAPVLKP